MWLSVQYRVELRFGDVTLSKPTHNEADGEKAEDLFPNAARLRNLTCVLTRVFVRVWVSVERSV